jgi:hypothetical protein
LIFRPKNILLNELILNIDILKVLEKTRSILQNRLSNIDPWFIYSLPDALWIFSFTTTILYFSDNIISSKNVFWFIFIIGFPVILEFAQKYNIISGTFDINDIIFYILGYALSILTFKKR